MFVVLSLSLMFDVLCLSLMFDIQCPNLMLDCQILHEYYKNNYTFCLFFIGIIESQKRYGIETFIFIFSTQMASLRVHTLGKFRSDSERLINHPVHISSLEQPAFIPFAHEVIKNTNVCMLFMPCDPLKFPTVLRSC